MFTQTTHANFLILLLLDAVHVGEDQDGVEEGGAALLSEALHLLQDGGQGQQHLADVAIITVCNVNNANKQSFCEIVVSGKIDLSS